jgi:2-oxoisovalerate dehydrogenase E1 component
LKIVYPSSPYDAKGLLCESFNDPNPVLFFEHKALYRSIESDVPESYYTLPIGKGKYISEGQSATVITYGMGVHWAMEIKSKEELDIDISAWICENMFDKLDAPVYRVGSLDTPVPFNKVLEDHFLPKARFETKLKELLDY